MYSVELKSRAIKHIKKSTLWYTQKQVDLGGKFLDELEIAFDSLAINPFYSLRYKDVRGYSLKKFPFIILYRVNEKKFVVSIIAVFHTAQNPIKYP
jgi:plasmid stabilization system protein ParE